MSANPELKTIKVPNTLTRAAFLMEETVGEKTTKRVSISSDVPYLRYDWASGEDYYEVLGHGPGDIEDGRLKLGLPALYNHRRDDLIGRATKYENDGHRLTVGTLDELIWSESDFAKTKRKDIESGCLPGTSVGYEILDEGVKIGTKDGIPVYKFRWSPHEFSFCTIEADTTVGAGRSREEEAKTGLREILVINHGKTVKSVDGTHLNQQKAQSVMSTPANPETTPAIDTKAERAAAISEFKARCKRIDDHTAAIRSDKWREIVSVVANRHKEGEADFEAFRTEANNAIDAYTSKQAEGRGDAASGIQIVGERQRNPNERSGGGGQTLGSLFARAKNVQEAFRSGQFSATVEMPGMHCMGALGKRLLAERAGWQSSDLSAVNVSPQQMLVPLGTQRTTIMDLISPGTTDAASIPYPRENSLGSINGTAIAATANPRVGTTAEAGQKPRWTPDLTTETANVRKIAVVTSVPDEMLSDFSGLQSYIDARLPWMVDIEAEYQILYGDGLGNNIKGIISQPNVQQRTFATSWYDTITKAITDIRAYSFFEPDGIAMHPFDWEVAKLEKDLNGMPYAGGPFYAPYGQGVFVEKYTYLGLPVAITTSVTATAPVVGAWKLGAQYFMKDGMRIESTKSNKDDFEKNMVSLRAEERLALAVYRPVCFEQITGGTARS